MMKQLSLCAAALALALASVPAQAEWKGYVNREIGFSFNAPGEVKTEKADAGGRRATVFRSMEDNVEFKVTVADAAGVSEADAIKAASDRFKEGTKVLSETEARVDSSYGRKLTVDLPDNGGRSMAAIYFKNDHLIQLVVTVLPANGDYLSPDLGRFVESVSFLESRAEPDATELELVP